MNNPAVMQINQTQTTLIQKLPNHVRRKRIVVIQVPKHGPSLRELQHDQYLLPLLDPVEELDNVFMLYLRVQNNLVFDVQLILIPNLAQIDLERLRRSRRVGGL